MNKSKKKIKIPKFKSESAERKFWSKYDLSKNFQPKDFERVSFPNLMPSSQSVSIRIPRHILVRVKERANEMQVPYQSLIKRYIAEAIGK